MEICVYVEYVEHIALLSSKWLESLTCQESIESSSISSMAQPRQAAFGLWKYARRAAQYKMGLETDVAIQIGGQRHVVKKWRT